MTPQLCTVSYRPRGGARLITTKPITADAAEKLAFCLNLQGYPAEVLPAPAVKAAAATA